MRPLHHHGLAQWMTLFKRSLSAWSDDYARNMGAALSYYSVFSMAPLLLLVISIAGLVFGQDAARARRTVHNARRSDGRRAAKTLQEMLSAMSSPSILGIAFSLMVSLVLTAAVSALGRWWGGFFGEWELLCCRS